MPLQEQARRGAQRDGIDVGQLVQVEDKLNGVDVRPLTVVLREKEQSLLQRRERKDFTDGGRPIQTGLLVEGLQVRNNKRFPMALTSN